MRGQQERTPKGHPLRQVRKLVDQAVDQLNPSFCRLYPEGGRPSIPREQLPLALMLQAIYGIRSKRMLIEQSDYNRLFRKSSSSRPGVDHGWEQCSVCTWGATT